MLGKFVMVKLYLFSVMEVALWKEK